MRESLMIKSERYSPAPGVVLREVAGERLLIPVKGHIADLRIIYSLDEVGACIWNTLCDGGDMEDIVAAVTAEFEVEQNDCRHDVMEFMERLYASGLLMEDGSSCD